MRRVVLWLLLLAAVWLVVTRRTDAERLAETLARGRWQWVAVALLVQVLYYVVFALLYQSAFRAVQLPRRLREIIPVLLASLFINVVAPSGGVGGNVLFMDDTARRGEPPARAAAAVLLAIVSDLAMLGLVLAAGMAYLFTRHDLQTYEAVSALLLMALIGGLSIALVVALWLPAVLRGLLRWVQQIVNRAAARLRRRPVWPADWAERNAAEFSGAAAAMRAHPWRVGSALGSALAAHGLDLVTLSVLFLAFRHPVGAGPLLAGYGIGMLFWVVSPTPGGIGFVEGVMALVYTSLGLPGSVAIVVPVAFRGITFWLPLLAGLGVVSRTKSFRAAEDARLHDLGTHAVALLVAAVGLIDVLSAVLPALTARLAVLQEVIPETARHGARITAALAGFGLLMLAHGLWRRKQLAWLLSILLLCLSIVSHMLKGLDYEESAVAAVLVLWLGSLRTRFQARSDPPSVVQGLRALLAALLFTVAYGTLGFYVLDRQLGTHFGLAESVGRALALFAGLYRPGPVPPTAYGRYFIASFYVVGAATFGYGLVMLLRPVLLRRPATEEERARAAAIVEAHGHSSLARIALLPGKSYHFTAGGCVVAYTVQRRVALALGDPIGPSAHIAAAIGDFRDFAGQNDWRPAFVQVLPDYLEAYRAAGFDQLRLGHEAIVDLASFTLEGGRSKGLRAALNRMNRLGHRTELHRPPLSEELLAELRVVSDEWLAMVKGTERRFSLGWFDEDYLRAGPVMAVHAPDGIVTAFANIIPEYQANEATIDLMRRRREIERDTMEFLFISLFQWAQAEGYATFNLGLSPLAGVGEEPGDSALERTAHFAYQRLNRYYSFRGLHAFKEQFRPRWSPRYLIYPGAASLPSVVIATLRADAGASVTARVLWRR
jgi:phosphatidylglycerol lysyltransferase